MQTEMDRLTVGERVAWYRRRRGMSQEVLAGLVGRTADWLQKAERNRIELDRVSVIRALANILDLSLTDLLSEGPTIAGSTDSSKLAVSSLRSALTDYRQITPFLAGRGGRKPPAVEHLQRDVGAIWSAYQDSRYGYAVSRLPTLLADASAAVGANSGTDRQRAHAVLALGYHAAAALLTKLGEADLAWIAADRGLMAAREAEDPLITGSLFRSVAHALQSTGRYAEAADLVQDAASYLRASRIRDTPAGVAVYGTLLLAGSMAAARMRDRNTTLAYLSEAGSAAQDLNHDSNYLWTAFGPTNVAVHRVSTSMELGDTQVAIELGTKVDTTGLPVERRVRHALEVARAFMRRNHCENALSIVLDAERLAPEQVRTHFLARQLARAMVRAQRGRPGAEMAGFVTRVRALD